MIFWVWMMIYDYIYAKTSKIIMLLGSTKIKDNVNY